MQFFVSMNFFSGGWKSVFERMVARFISAGEWERYSFSRYLVSFLPRCV